ARRAAITNDGSYFMYFVMNKPRGGITMVVKSTKNEWNKEFVGIGDAFFSGDSKKVIFKSHDTIYAYILGTNKQAFIPGIISFQAERSGKNKWIAFKKVNDKRNLFIKNLYADEEKS